MSKLQTSNSDSHKERTPSVSTAGSTSDDSDHQLQLTKQKKLIKKMRSLYPIKSVVDPKLVLFVIDESLLEQVRQFPPATKADLDDFCQGNHDILVSTFRKVRKTLRTCFDGKNGGIGQLKYNIVADILLLKKARDVISNQQKLTFIKV